MDALQLAGFVIGMAGVWLTIRKNIWCFPVGIVYVLLTAWLVYRAALFADMLQHLIYFVLLVIGWYKWSAQHDEEIRVSRLDINSVLLLSLIFVAGSAVMGYLLSHYSRASYPYWDSSATVLSFIAQWLIAKRKIENWILWLVANPVYIVLYLLKGLEWYAVLYVVYQGMAYAGWQSWKRSYKMHADANG